MPETYAGLKCGLEIHQQLDTEHKLFCNCKARLSSEKPIAVITRKLRPVAGELGEIDIAALHETLQNKEFNYNLYPEESCEVEADEEPPHELNTEALEIALRIALKLNCTIPDELHIMRKQVLDGSNTTGFQRTLLVGLNGWIDTKHGRVGIENVSLEEESAQIIKREKNSVVYGLDRLGIPLIEIGTAPDIKTPEQAKEVAEHIGMVLRGTGKVKRGIGTIRQDLNVSIKGGQRVEIKGVQELKMIPKIIENEISRQQGLIKKGKQVPKEVRKAEPDCRTIFLRPLPGAARLYPETDIPPIIITPAILRKAGEISDIEKERERHSKFLATLGFDKEQAKQLILKGAFRPDQIELVQALTISFPLLDKKLIWNTVIEAPKDIKTRFNSRTENLTEKHFESVLQKLAQKQISKEAIPDILNEFSKNSNSDINSIIKSLGIKSLSTDELRKIIKKVIDSHKDVLERPNPEKPLMGLVMKEVRGRIAGDIVMKVLREEIERSKK